MTIFNCPGASRFRQPEPELIECPYCRKEIEIWTDEIKVKCHQCKKVVVRQSEQSCLDWCGYARECVGDNIYTNYMYNKAQTIKCKLLKELEEYFGDDVKWKNHAKCVMNFAEEILRKEKGDWHIVIPASILHDVGIKDLKNREEPSKPYYPEAESAGIARGMLLKFGLKAQHIDQICEIIAHHHTPGVINTLNFRILYDADQLAGLKNSPDTSNKARLKALIDEVFLTPAGKEIARDMYL